MDGTFSFAKNLCYYASELLTISCLYLYLCIYICFNTKSGDPGIGAFQGGRTWQAFGGGKNGHETFRQARIYNFRDTCVVFARNLKFSILTQ